MTAVLPEAAAAEPAPRAGETSPQQAPVPVEVIFCIPNVVEPLEAALVGHGLAATLREPPGAAAHGPKQRARS